MQKRWWNGPLEVRLSKLVRCSGPEPDMEYRIDLRLWVERTVQLSQSLTELAAVAPLIVEYRDGVLSA